MQVSGYNIKKALSNLMGRLTGYESCVFCGDRGNWKPMMGNVCVSAKDKKIEYELPMCEECFASQPLNAVLHAINNIKVIEHDTLRNHFSFNTVIEKVAGC